MPKGAHLRFVHNQNDRCFALRKGTRQQNTTVRGAEGEHNGVATRCPSTVYLRSALPKEGCEIFLIPLTEMGDCDSFCNIPMSSGSSGQDFVKNSDLYREFIAEREEILRHKWIESEKIGEDIGFEKALLDWVLHHRSEWKRERLDGSSGSGGK